MENVQQVKDNVKLFLEKACEICIEKGKNYEFECPICNGYAIGMKSRINGHIMASCSECGMRIRQ